MLLAGVMCWSFGAQAQTTVIDSIYHNGIYRHYRLYVPAIYTGTQAVPLVFNLHGYTSNSFAQQYYGNFMPIADTANFLVVHPDGTLLGGNQYWNAGFTPGNPNDLDFLETLIDSLAADYNIDQDMVYSTGMSNGGIMSYYMACQMNNRIAAIASVTGTMTVSMYNICNPQTPVPVLEIHGTMDPTVPYNGNTTSKHIDTVINYWRNNNNTDISPVIFNYPDIMPGDGCTATEYAYLNGDAGSETVLIKITNGGHTWPGAPVIIGTTNQDFNASVRIWQFFRKYKKSQFSGVDRLADKKQIKVYPNPTNAMLNIDGVEANTVVKIFSIQGQLITELLSNGDKTTLDVSSFLPGVYLIQTNSGVQKFIKE